MQKIKFTKKKGDSDGLKGLTIQLDPALYKRLCKLSSDLEITKRVIVNTALTKLLDEIEEYGIEF
ncbi:MAG: hypothetical protein ACRDCE_03685 [Cetobacterium sp.]|uniref:hypothetical protein n=1 Tax=Cetobacterium sp. TaxID=2071632 RepID=UPI003EE8117F